MDRRLNKRFKHKTGYVPKLWLVESILIVVLGSRTDQLTRTHKKIISNKIHVSVYTCRYFIHVWAVCRAKLFTHCPFLEDKTITWIIVHSTGTQANYWWLGSPMLHHCALALQVTKQHEQLRGILQKRIFLFPDINVHLNTKYKKHFNVSNYLSLFFFKKLFFLMPKERVWQQQVAKNKRTVWGKLLSGRNSPIFLSSQPLWFWMAWPIPAILGSQVKRYSAHTSRSKIYKFMHFYEVNFLSPIYSSNKYIVVLCQ